MQFSKYNNHSDNYYTILDACHIHLQKMHVCNKDQSEVQNNFFFIVKTICIGTVDS